MKKDDKKENKELKFVEPEVKPFLHESHKLPKTRREFIAHGFIGISASVVLPSFASMLVTQNSAFAASAACELPTFQGGLPYICIDVGGGMNIAGSNAMVGIVDGGEHQEDVSPVGYSSSDYIRLGITPSEHPSQPGRLEGKYGLKFHRASGILEGMNSVLDGQTMPNGRPVADGVDGLVFCTRTSDDTATNQINTVFMANKAGAQGELVQLIGNSATDTGARSAAPSDQVNLALRPTRVRSNGDASGLLSLGDQLSGNSYLRSSDSGGQARVQKFMDRISKMSKTRLDDLAQKGSIGQIQEVLNCSFDNAKQLFQVYSAEQLNPANDPTVMNVFNGSSEQVASVAKLVIDKIAGSGTITIGGGDYHGGMVTNTHAKDVQVGRAIGQCILLAKEKGENLAIHLYTDGGVAADSGGASQPANVLGLGQIEKVRWTGDSGTRSAALLLFYKHDHDGSSLVRANGNGPRRQVGNFVKGGGVQLNTVIGNSTVNLWKAIMLNYLAAQGREGDFEDIFGIGSLPPDYESLIRMKKIA
ncbi:MAG: hypothetical protein CME62_17015 [Halobacteriovoraceae bacterium]|nr:hypothetical protein [Halobacteriovoraceae bacterium]|tara:strand:- start:18226 stop:19821 length:1596 start_codon:yes stop_codon:yes gene_type:complete